jgi:hypothetical protein
MKCKRVQQRLLPHLVFRRNTAECRYIDTTINGDDEQRAVPIGPAKWGILQHLHVLGR